MSPDQLYAKGYRAISWAIGIGEADKDPQKFLAWVKWLMKRIENTGEVPKIYSYKDIPPLEPVR